MLKLKSKTNTTIVFLLRRIKKVAATAAATRNELHNKFSLFFSYINCINIFIAV